MMKSFGKGFLILGLLILLPSFLPAQKFLPDDPLWKDPDQLPIPMPRPIEISQIADLLESTFLRRVDGEIKPSENVNTLGEVPNSSWFTNRIGFHPMTIDELVKGPNQVDGPLKPWVIVSAKSEGITPGFTIRDARGDIYFVKFDPLDNPQMATSAEVICTKFFHAFGYHVPENYLALIREKDLEISPDVSIREWGRDRKMTTEDVNRLLRDAARRGDGTIQVLASRALSGEPLGPFAYWHTRSDDPNDIFPHENHRELRGLRVFSAWLNHDDARSINSLDMYVSQGKQGYVRHHLLDFGSCLGSGSVKVQSRRGGNEYFLEPGPIPKTALTLGLWERPWRHVDYPDYPSIGRFEADFFDPARWKPEYPNPAFERMQTTDAFWATRIVMRFTDEMIRAIVKTGQLTNREAEDYLIETLIKRRDKIIGYYLAQINPLDGFFLSGNKDPFHLEFENLSTKAGLSTTSSYEYQWFRFDNDNLTLKPLADVQSTPVPSLLLPHDHAPYLMVRIRTLSLEQEKWQKKVEVFIRNGSKKSVVGIEREP
ncbi:hypothetical protein MYX78_04600 [Acidobacteria bacterium AH-259-G07]|nr:hypothetical protein [Acidobacteria bacterium AH-259-G07]